MGCSFDFVDCPCGHSVKIFVLCFVCACFYHFFPFVWVFDEVRYSINIYFLFLFSFSANF